MAAWKSASIEQFRDTINKAFHMTILNGGEIFISHNSIKSSACIGLTVGISILRDMMPTWLFQDLKFSIASRWDKGW